ncbi:transposase, MuDR, plant [Tanacetum coccineum]|uniref:Transposase, MuDR, plant n=1 Tax=Tanacetum coccineum TaxID=301880 RepID=A0ABQ5G303_9ASTR
MASSSSSSSYLIRFHRGGVFVRDPFSYDYEMLSEISNVDMAGMNFVAFVKLLMSECSSDIKQIFYHVAGLGLELGNVEQNDDSDNDLDDIFACDSESEESDTAIVDHLSDGEEEVYDARTRKPDPTPRKMFDANFLSRIYNGLPRDEYAEKDVSAEKGVTDKDNLGDHWPIHDPTIKWKLMRPVLGEKYESPEQLKRALAFYALANGYKLYYEVNNPRRLLAKYCRDEKDRKCPFRLWASRMQNKKTFQIKKLIDEHACSRTYEYEDHYGMLCSYASEILNSNPGSTCKMGVDSMPDRKNYFSRFYVCFKGLKEGWLQGCRRVIGIDGYFLKTICKGELMTIGVGLWQLLINEFGIVYSVGLTSRIVLIQGIIEASKMVIAVWLEHTTKKATYTHHRKFHTKHLEGCSLKVSSCRAYFSTTNKLVMCGRMGFRMFNALLVDAKTLKIMCQNGNKDVFVNAYNHYIEGMDGIDQWPSTDYQKPLPPIKRIMPGRPPHKRNRYAMEYDGNKTKISRIGQLNHCTLCKKPGHSQKACPSKPKRTASVGQVSATGEIVSASVGKVTATGEIVCASGGNVTASGEIVSARGGNVSARGGKVSARGCKMTARGGIVTASRGNVTARGGKVIANGGKVIVIDTASSAVRISGGVIKLRECVWIRSPKKERSSNADSESSSSMNKLRTFNGKVVRSRGRGDGSKSRIIVWVFLDMHGQEGITPEDCIIHAQSQFEIALSQSKPIASQDQEEPSQQQPRQQELRQQQPRQQQPMIRRTSERIAHIMFNNPPTPRPRLDLDDAISME